MLMIRPDRWRTIDLSTAWMQVNTADRFVASTASQSSRFMRSMSVSRVMPALLIRMSTLPNVDDAFATVAGELRAGGPTYAYVYIDTVDATGHQYGPTSPEFDAEVTRLNQLDIVGVYVSFTHIQHAKIRHCSR